MLMVSRMADRLMSGERGQGLAEYGMIVLFVAAVVMVALRVLGLELAVAFGEITSRIGALLTP